MTQRVMHISPSSNLQTAHPPLPQAAFATGSFYATPLPFRLRYIDYLSELYFMDAAVEEALTLVPATSSAQASGAGRAQLSCCDCVSHSDCAAGMTALRRARHRNISQQTPGLSARSSGCCCGRSPTL